jgi:lysyl-tRNA synthetase class 2
MPLPPWHPESLAARLPFLRRRAALTAETRAFFTARGYTEVETPALVPVPGMEVHLRAFRSAFRPHLGAGAETPLWLRTSPELALKRLLVAGAGKVFELARCWRNGELSPRHAPEFTMLEWYAPGLTLDGLMDETEKFVRTALPPIVAHQNVTTDVTIPFERLTMAEAFRLFCNGLDILSTVNPETAEGDAAALHAAAAGLGLPPHLNWEDAFFHLLLTHIEPRIGQGRATFLTHWPAPQAALAKRDPADPRAALRFELFVAGLELANAFEELTDPAEQRLRFERDIALREGPDAWPVDEDFLQSLEHGMPPTSGIALGFDRLAMLASGAQRIDQVLWLPSAIPTSAARSAGQA